MFADELNTFVKIDLEKGKIEQIWMRDPMTIGYVI